MRLRRTAHLLILVITFVSLSLPAGRTGAGRPTVSIEPCSLLTLEEVGAVIHGTAIQGRPHVVKINTVPVGGDCSYRSVQNKLLVINLMVDAYPGGHQPKAFELARQRPHVTDLSGVGDRAFTVTNPNGPPSVTFLRGMILVTIHVQGLGIDAAKQLASFMVPRLPDSTGKAPAPLDSLPSSSTPQPQNMPLPSRPSSPPIGQGTNQLDPALVGSWLLKRPEGGVPYAHLFVQQNGIYSMKVGSKLLSGRIEGEHGVLRLVPKQGGNSEEIQYRIIGTNQMEWSDQQGNVTVMHRKGSR
jgi:hypothetical protein